MPEHDTSPNWLTRFLDRLKSKRQDRAINEAITSFYENRAPQRQLRVERYEPSPVANFIRDLADPLKQAASEVVEGEDVEAPKSVGRMSQMGWALDKVAEVPVVGDLVGLTYLLDNAVTGGAAGLYDTIRKSLGVGVTTEEIEGFTAEGTRVRDITSELDIPLSQLAQELGVEPTEDELKLRNFNRFVRAAELQTRYFMRGGLERGYEEGELAKPETEAEQFADIAGVMLSDIGISIPAISPMFGLTKAGLTAVARSKTLMQTTRALRTTAIGRGVLGSQSLRARAVAKFGPDVGAKTADKLLDALTALGIDVEIGAALGAMHSYNMEYMGQDLSPEDWTRQILAFVGYGLLFGVPIHGASVLKMAKWQRQWQQQLTSGPFAGMRIGQRVQIHRPDDPGAVGGNVTLRLAGKNAPKRPKVDKQGRPITEEQRQFHEVEMGGRWVYDDGPRKGKFAKGPTREQYAKSKKISESQVALIKDAEEKIRKQDKAGESPSALVFPGIDADAQRVQTLAASWYNRLRRSAAGGSADVVPVLARERAALLRIAEDATQSSAVRESAVARARAIDYLLNDMKPTPGVVPLEVENLAVQVVTDFDRTTAMAHAVRHQASGTPQGRAVAARIQELLNQGIPERMEAEISQALRRGDLRASRGLRKNDAVKDNKGRTLILMQDPQYGFVTARQSLPRDKGGPFGPPEVVSLDDILIRPKRGRTVRFVDEDGTVRVGKVKTVKGKDVNTATVETPKGTVVVELRNILDVGSDPVIARYHRRLLWQSEQGRVIVMAGDRVVVSPTKIITPEGEVVTMIEQGKETIRVRNARGEEYDIPTPDDLQQQLLTEAARGQPVSEPTPVGQLPPNVVVRPFSSGTRPTAGNHIHYVAVPEGMTDAFDSALKSGKMTWEQFQEMTGGGDAHVLPPELAGHGYVIYGVEVPLRNAGVTYSEAAKRAVSILSGKGKTTQLATYKSPVTYSPETFSQIRGVYKVPQSLHVKMASAKHLSSLKGNELQEYLRRLLDFSDDVDTRLAGHRKVAREAHEEVVAAVEAKNAEIFAQRAAAYERKKARVLTSSANEAMEAALVEVDGNVSRHLDGWIFTKETPDIWRMMSEDPNTRPLLWLEQLDQGDGMVFLSNNTDRMGVLFLSPASMDEGTRVYTWAMVDDPLDHTILVESKDVLETVRKNLSREWSDFGATDQVYQKASNFVTKSYAVRNYDEFVRLITDLKYEGWYPSPFITSQGVYSGGYANVRTAGMKLPGVRGTLEQMETGGSLASLDAVYDGTVGDVILINVDERDAVTAVGNLKEMLDDIHATGTRDIQGPDRIRRKLRLHEGGQRLATEPLPNPRVTSTPVSRPEGGLMHGTDVAAAESIIRSGGLREGSSVSRTGRDFEGYEVTIQFGETTAGTPYSSPLGPTMHPGAEQTTGTLRDIKRVFFDGNAMVEREHNIEGFNRLRRALDESGYENVPIEGAKWVEEPDGWIYGGEVEFGGKSYKEHVQSLAERVESGGRQGRRASTEMYDQYEELLYNSQAIDLDTTLTPEQKRAAEARVNDKLDILIPEMKRLNLLQDRRGIPWNLGIAAANQNERIFQRKMRPLELVDPTDPKSKYRRPPGPAKSRPRIERGNLSLVDGGSVGVDRDMPLEFFFKTNKEQSPAGARLAEDLTNADGAILGAKGDLFTWKMFEEIVDDPVTPHKPTHIRTDKGNLDLRPWEGEAGAITFAQSQAPTKRQFPGHEGIGPNPFEAGRVTYPVFQHRGDPGYIARIQMDGIGIYRAYQFDYATAGGLIWKLEHYIPSHNLYTQISSGRIKSISEFLYELGFNEEPYVARMETYGREGPVASRLAEFGVNESWTQARQKVQDVLTSSGVKLPGSVGRDRIGPTYDIDWPNVDAVSRDAFREISKVAKILRLTQLWTDSQGQPNSVLNTLGSYQHRPIPLFGMGGRHRVWDGDLKPGRAAGLEIDGTPLGLMTTQELLDAWNPSKTNLPEMNEVNSWLWAREFERQPGEPLNTRKVVYKRDLTPDELELPGGMNYQKIIDEFIQEQEMGELGWIWSELFDGDISADDIAAKNLLVQHRSTGETLQILDVELMGSEGGVQSTLTVRNGMGVVDKVGVEDVRFAYSSAGQHDLWNDFRLVQKALDGDTWYSAFQNQPGLGAVEKELGLYGWNNVDHISNQIGIEVQDLVQSGAVWFEADWTGSTNVAPAIYGDLDKLVRLYDRLLDIDWLTSADYKKGVRRSLGSAKLTGTLEMFTGPDNILAWSSETVMEWLTEAAIPKSLGNYKTLRSEFQNALRDAAYDYTRQSLPDDSYAILYAGAKYDKLNNAQRAALDDMRKEFHMHKDSPYHAVVQEMWYRGDLDPNMAKWALEYRKDLGWLKVHQGLQDVPPSAYKLTRAPQIGMSIFGYRGLNPSYFEAQKHPLFSMFESSVRKSWENMQRREQSLTEWGRTWLHKRTLEFPDGTVRHATTKDFNFIRDEVIAAGGWDEAVSAGIIKANDPRKALYRELVERRTDDRYRHVRLQLMMDTRPVRWSELPEKVRTEFRRLHPWLRPEEIADDFYILPTQLDDMTTVGGLASRKGPLTTDEIDDFIGLLRRYNSADELPDGVVEWMRNEFDLWQRYGQENYWTNFTPGDYTVEVFVPGLADFGGEWRTVGYADSFMRGAKLSDQLRGDVGRFGPDAQFRVRVRSLNVDDVIIETLNQKDLMGWVSSMKDRVIADDETLAALFLTSRQKKKLSPVTRKPVKGSLRERINELSPERRLSAWQEMVLYERQLSRLEYRYEVSRAYRQLLDRNSKNVMLLDENMSAARGVPRLFSDENKSLASYAETWAQDAIGIPNKGDRAADWVWAWATMLNDGPAIFGKALWDKYVKGQAVIDPSQVFRFETWHNPGLAKKRASELIAFQAQWRMALNPATAVVNATQYHIYTVPMLTREFGVAAANQTRGSWFDAIGLLARQHRDEPLTGKWAELAKIVEESAVGIQAGRHVAGQTAIAQSASGSLSRPVTLGLNTPGKAAAYLEHGAMFMFNSAEQINRMATAIAVYRAARHGRARGGPVSHEVAMERVRDVIAKTQFWYDELNLPEFMRQGGPFVRLAMQFKPFQVNAIRYEVDMATAAARGLAKGDLTPALAAAQHIALWSAYGGLTGVIRHPIISATLWAFGVLPFVPSPGELLAKLHGKYRKPADLDPAPLEEAPEKPLLGPKASSVLLHGLPALLGTAIGGRLGVGGQEITSMRAPDFLGPHMSVYWDWINAVRTFYGGDAKQRGAHQTLPGFAMGLMLPSLVPGMTKVPYARIFGSSVGGMTWGLGERNLDIKDPARFGVSKQGELWQEWLTTSPEGRKFVQRILASALRNSIRTWQIYSQGFYRDVRGHPVEVHQNDRTRQAILQLTGFPTPEREEQQVYLDWVRPNAYSYEATRMQMARSVAAALERGDQQRAWELLIEASRQGIVLTKESIETQIENRSQDSFDAFIENIPSLLRQERP